MSLSTVIPFILDETFMNLCHVPGRAWFNFSLGPILTLADDDSKSILSQSYKKGNSTILGSSVDLIN